MIVIGVRENVGSLCNMCSQLNVVMYLLQTRFAISSNWLASTDQCILTLEMCLTYMFCFAVDLTVPSSTVLTQATPMDFHLIQRHNQQSDTALMNIKQAQQAFFSAITPQHHIDPKIRVFFSFLFPWLFLNSKGCTALTWLLSHDNTHCFISVGVWLVNERCMHKFPFLRITFSK